MKIESLLLSLIVFFILAVGSPVLSEEADSESSAEPLNRMDLLVPDKIWSRVLENSGCPNGVLGYTSDEMSYFKSSSCILPGIERLFRDVKNVPRFSGRIGNLLMENPSDFAWAATIGFSLLEGRAGAGVTPPSGNEWGLEYIDSLGDGDEGVELHEAFDAFMRSSRSYMPGQYNFHEIPEPVLRLILRILIAADKSKPVINQAWDENLYIQYFNVDDMGEIEPDSLYAFASAPFKDSDAIVPRQSFEALEKLDMNYLAFGSIMFLKLLEAAIAEFMGSRDESEIGDIPYDSFEFDVGKFRVGVFSGSNNEISGFYNLVIDLGGDDTYTGVTASPQSFSEPISIVIDISGNDNYISDIPGSLACGNHGIGGIFDLNGDDEYFCVESGIGCAWFGAGLVVDYAGDDIYRSEFWSQGAAHAGVGLLIDLAGSDNYDCKHQSQAFGSTLGVGLLVDVDGDDIYFTDPEGNISIPFNGHSVSFAQGTGFGRRADFGDGHNLGGGYGILVDGAGDDSYTGSVYSQGAGYWWAVGCLEDRGGNDTYYNEWYSLGSAPHFAIGCCVDLTGDDRYNVGNTDLSCQTQACARDGSIAVFIDGEGDDIYYHHNRCAGSGDLNSIALFWDRTGNDQYTINRDSPYIADRSYGDATEYPIFHTFRDDMKTIGIFLDTGGFDTYTELLPENPDPLLEIPRILFGDNKEWRHREGPVIFGYGLDIDFYQ